MAPNTATVIGPAYDGRGNLLADGEMIFVRGRWDQINGSLIVHGQESVAVADGDWSIDLVCTDGDRGELISASYIYPDHRSGKPISMSLGVFALPVPGTYPLGGIIGAEDHPPSTQTDALAAALAAAATATLAASQPSVQAAAKAQQYAADAEAARDAAIAAGAWDYTPNDAAALAAITGMTAGETALVRDTMHVWEYSGSAWVDTGESPIASKADAYDANAAASKTPLIVSGRTVPLWLEGDLLSANGVSESLAEDATRNVTAKYTLGASRPLMTSGSSVFMWQNPDGSIDWAGNPDSESGYPDRIVSDGRSLHRLGAKVGAIRANPTGGERVRVLVMGDSWAYRTEITTALRALFEAEGIGTRGHGWQDVDALRQIDGVTVSKSGFVVVDASDGDTSYPYGVGFDGHNMTSDTDTATFSVGNLVATDIKIYSHNHGGTWRYRIDGGAWVIINAGSDAALRVTTISGLNDAAHTLDIDTAGNAGTVSIAGVYSHRGGTGAEISKAGNASLDAIQLATFSTPELAAAQYADLSPDVVICILGTNDYRRPGCDLATYIAGVSAFAQAVRAGQPDAGLIFVCPAQSNPAGQLFPLTEYTDVLNEWCAKNDAEYVSWTLSMGTYAQTQPLGQWEDTAHLSNAGASRAVSILSKIFQL